MGLSSLAYHPLKEEIKLTGWSKTTVDYLLANRKKVEISIRGIAKGLSKVLQKTDVEDIYMDILTYLYNCSDYDISKAYKRSNVSGMIVSLEGYVNSCIKYCVIRAVTNNYSSEKKLVRERNTDKDGKEISLFDTIPDTKDNSIEDFNYQLDTLCKYYEGYRYSFGPDIFLIWFIRLQTILNDKNDRYKDILLVLGISKKDIHAIEKETGVDGVMINIAKAITLVGIEEAIEILRDYTYCADKIQRVVELF